MPGYSHLKRGEDLEGVSIICVNHTISIDKFVGRWHWRRCINSIGVEVGIRRTAVCGSGYLQVCYSVVSEWKIGDRNISKCLTNVYGVIIPCVKSVWAE